MGSGAKDFHYDIVGFTPEGFVQLMCAVPFRRHHEADNHIFKVAAQITFEISNQVLERKSVIELILRIGKSLKVYINCIRQRKRGRCQRETAQLTRGKSCQKKPRELKVGQGKQSCFNCYM